MLEILLIIAISKKIAAMVKEKGRSAAGYVTLFVVLWFGGEITGAIMATVVHEVAEQKAGGNPFNPQPPMAQDNGFWMAYLAGLIGAAIGGGSGYAVAAAVPAIEQPPRPDPRDFDDDDDDYERERRRRRRAAEADDGKFADDERAPRRRRPNADDGKFEEDRSGR